MRIKGKKPKNPNIEIVVIPRGDESQNIVFMAQAVLDLEPFDKICPAPNPPSILRPSGERGVDVEDKKFRAKFREYLKRKSDWLIIQSLRATPDLDWEKVDYSNPETWHLYLEELKDFKLTENEINLILNAVYCANGLNEAKIEAARESFLAGRQEEMELQESSLSSERESIQPGEPVKDLESALPA